MSRAAAHAVMSCRSIAAAIRSGNWSGVHAKAGTPMPVVEKLREAMLHSLDEPDGRKFLAANACEPMHMTRAEFVLLQQSELEKWSKVIKEAGIQPQ